MKKYFKVTAKCGHVGRNNYIPMDFFVAADSGKEAAAAVRQMPRVKHDQKDAILNVERISFEAFCQGLHDFREDPFNRCTSIQQQRATVADIADRILPELGSLSWEREPKTRRNAKKASRYGYDREGRLETKRSFRFDRAEMLA